MGGDSRGRWRVTDAFGDDWQLALVSPREGTPRSTPPPAPGDAYRAETLTYFAFAGGNESATQTADVLLEVYDALTGDCLADRRRTGGDERPLAEIAPDVERAISSAFRTGLLSILPAPRPEWTLLALPKAPASDATPPVADQTTYFVLRVVDEVGASVDGISVVFTADGSDRTMTTDGAGMARLDGIDGSSASVRLGSIAAVRDKLKPRWTQARDPNIPVGDGVVVREVGDDALDSIALESATLTTLVLTPYFQCHEIPGAHFAFGRSFVQSAALELLSEIAEALTGDAERMGLIFGHTDLAGPEALNKELSERRAKALYSLLTQDADGWEELYSGSADGPNWQEKWDLEEIQHMLNALGVTDDAGDALAEDGVRGALTTQAVKRFQGGDYPDCPAEQAPLTTDGNPGKKTRHELFLAYAKRVSRKAVDPARITKLGDAKFMGCGEFNPMSLTVKDEESRRAVIFLYDPAAEPQNLPCKLRSLGPCKSNCGPLPTTPDPDGKPPYRCKIYQGVAKKCPCQGGPDLSHDLILRFPITLDAAGQLSNTYTLDSDDGTIHQERSLSSDSRADDDKRTVISFEHLPGTHAYRLTGKEDADPYVLFDYTTLADLLLRFSAVDVSNDTDTDALIAAWTAPDDGDGDDESADDDAGEGGAGSDDDDSAPASGAGSDAGSGSGSGSLSPSEGSGASGGDPAADADAGGDDPASDANASSDSPPPDADAHSEGPPADADLSGDGPPADADGNPPPSGDRISGGSAE